MHAPGKPSPKGHGSVGLAAYVPSRLAVLALAAALTAYFLLDLQHLMASPVHLVLLVFHEAGHLLTPFGELPMLLGGTLWQLAVPLALAAYFALTQQSLAAALLLFVLALSLADVGVYAADAQARALPLITHDPGTHDWWQVLGRLGLLEQSGAVAAGFFAQAWLVFALACWLGVGASRRDAVVW